MARSRRAEHRIRVEVSGCHVRMLFDDGRMNLLSHEGLDAIADAFETTRKLVVRPGVGSRTILLIFESGRRGLFAAGADMREMRSFSAADADEFSKKGQELFAKLRQFPALTAVIVDGDCFGGALDFMMSFDVRIATSRARFSHPGGRIGIITGFGGTSSWRGAARPATAAPMFLSNEILSPADALDLGLVHEVTDDPEEIVERLSAARTRITNLAGLKRLTTARKNLASLVLQAKRLVALDRAAGNDGGNTTHGYSRDSSRHLFG